MSIIWCVSLTFHWNRILRTPMTHQWFYHQNHQNSHHHLTYMQLQLKRRLPTPRCLIRHLGYLELFSFIQGNEVLLTWSRRVYCIYSRTVTYDTHTGATCNMDKQLSTIWAVNFNILWTVLHSRKSHTMWTEKLCVVAYVIRKYLKYLTNHTVRN